MNWLDKLERKFGRYAIDNLMLYIVILYGFGFMLRHGESNILFYMAEPGCSGNLTWSGVESYYIYY